MIKEGLQKLVDGRNLTYDESQAILKDVMLGKATSTQIAAFLTALKMKGETVEEITAFVKVMRMFSNRISPVTNGRLVDTCGTGGDLIKTFNVSTTAAFVVAGAGVTVAKHGNRSVSSKCGSADVMEKLGLNLEVDPNVVKKAIEKIGVGFMFAPAFHPAMKYALQPRKDIGIRTVFNILGPLTNPANASAQLLGVYDSTLLEPLANVLKNMGCQEAMVVYGSDGLDEISTVGKTTIAWLKENSVTVLEKTPTEFNIEKATVDDVKGTTPEESAEITFKILYGCENRKDPRRDMVLVNAAAGIILGGKANNFSHGIESARRSIESGEAYKKLKALIKMYKGNLNKLEELELRYA
jgi:anthranilate phosphoribosyltransferase